MRASLSQTRRGCDSRERGRSGRETAAVAKRRKLARVRVGEGGGGAKGEIDTPRLNARCYCSTAAFLPIAPKRNYCTLEALGGNNNKNALAA